MTLEGESRKGIFHLKTQFLAVFISLSGANELLWITASSWHTKEGKKLNFDCIAMLWQTACSL